MNIVNVKTQRTYSYFLVLMKLVKLVRFSKLEIVTYTNYFFEVSKCLNQNKLTVKKSN